MGVIGAAVGREGVGLAGQALGGLFGGRQGAKSGANIGRAVGGVMGGAFPIFKKGGKVSKTGLAYVHKGEFVLPSSVKPTKAQKAKIMKLQKK